MLIEILNFLVILIGHTESCCIGDVTYRCSCLTYRFDDSSQILIVCAASILSIELYIIHKTTCILHSCYSTFYDFLTITVEFILDVRVARTDTCMNTLTLRILQCLYCHIDIFLYGTSQCTDSRPSHSLRDFDDRIIVTRTGDRESCFDDIDSQHLELLGNLNFLYSVELASGYLLAITQCCVKNK